MSAETQEQAQPAILEYGRYRLFETPGGGWKIARAVGTCERCQSCGCGEQAEPFDLPDFSKGQAAVLAWIAKNANTGLLGKMRAMIGRG